MARIHTITRNDGTKAQIGDFRFTMQAADLLPGVPSPVNTPCWECGAPIQAGEEYYTAEVQHKGNLYSNTALIHNHHVG
jgi:hypothetical protein